MARSRFWFDVILEIRFVVSLLVLSDFYCSSEASLFKFFMMIFWDFLTTSVKSSYDLRLGLLLISDLLLATYSYFGNKGPLINILNGSSE